MGCGESKQMAKGGEDNRLPENTVTVDNSGNDRVPENKEVLEVKDMDNEGVVNPLTEEIRDANLEKFVGEYTIMTCKLGGLVKRQDEFQEKCQKERKDLLTFLGNVRDVLQLSDASIQQMGDLGTILEKCPAKFQGLLFELSKLDVELQALSDFRFKGLERRDVGMFDMPEELRDALEELTTAANKLLDKGRIIRFGMLEMLREIYTAKWYITLNMFKAHQRDHLEMAKNKLEKEVGELRNEKEQLMEERDNSKTVMVDLEKENVKLQIENQNLKESNQELIREKMSLTKENQQLKASMLDIMMKFEADKHPAYPKEPDLRPEPPEDDDPAVPSDRHEPDLLPEQRTEMGHYQPVISSGEKVMSVVPSADSPGGGVQAPSKLDHAGQLPKPISDAQPPSDMKHVGSSGVNDPDEMVSVALAGSSVGSVVEDSNGRPASDFGVTKVPATKVGISKELADAVLNTLERVSRIGNSKAKTPNCKLRKSRMPSPSFPSSDLGILKVLSAISKEQEEIAAEDRAYNVRYSRAQNAKVGKSEIAAKKGPAPDARIPDKKLDKKCTRVQDLRVSDAKRSQDPVPEVQDAKEIQHEGVSGETKYQRRRKKKKEKEPGLFKTLFKGFICTRRSAHD